MEWLVNVDDFDVDTRALWDDLENMIEELKQKEESLLRKTPKDLEKITDPMERKYTQAKIQWLKSIYVTPLLELANRISFKLTNKLAEFKNLDNLSVRGQMFQIRNYLFSKGCTIEILENIIPKSQREVNILLAARKAGFDLSFKPNQSLSSDFRVKRATEYLEKFGIPVVDKQFNNDVGHTR